jgi:hypothetical protein
MPRLAMIAPVLAATIGGPFIASRLSNKTTATPLPAASSETSPATNPAPVPAAAGVQPVQPSVESAVSLVQANPAALEGTRFHSIDQVLRFDVTKEWVYRHWARKSTGPTDVGLFSVRVPLVMGTGVTALAGSLTYYFNTHGQVEHISLLGHTGDTAQLVSFLVRTYEFLRTHAPAGEELYQVKRGRRVQSELRTRPEPIAWSTSPQSSFAVELELARPGSRRFLPQRGLALEIPQVASASTTAPPDDSAESSGDSYLDALRYATPQEEGQVLWKRWPN